MHIQFVLNGKCFINKGHNALATALEIFLQWARQRHASVFVCVGHRQERGETQWPSLWLLRFNTLIALKPEWGLAIGLEGWEGSLWACHCFRVTIQDLAAALFSWQCLRGRNGLAYDAIQIQKQHTEQQGQACETKGNFG